MVCSVPDVAASVSAAAGAQSPGGQLQQQQLQRHQQQQQLQFLANALQLQSQLKTHVQAQHGGSAAAVCCAPKLQFADHAVAQFSFPQILDLYRPYNCQLAILWTLPHLSAYDCACRCAYSYDYIRA